ncbi:MAG TPA: zinc dependent phospholipase C family protein [Pyrinomonadaceae bacterium]
MPFVLTHKSIMLLARERIAQVRDALQAKKNTTGVVHTDFEARMLELAKKTYQMMSEPPHPTTTLPGQPYVRPLGDQISKFAVMGSMGPDITAFSALFAPGQGWIFDLMHKGNPDENREMVAAGTCEFAFKFWQLASTAITDEAQLKMIRAYVLGHLCHMAGDIISHPFINDLEWHQSTDSQNKLSHGDGEGSNDATVAQKVLRRRSLREGAAWDAWWPTVDEVPHEFFSVYADTLEEIYHARSRRPTGFTEFEDRFREFAPPSLTGALVKDGYTAYRNGIVSIGYGYGTWSWVAFLLPVTIPLIVLPVITAALPHSKQLFRDALLNDSRAWFEMLIPAVAFGGLASSIYGIWFASLSSQGVEGREGAGIAASVFSVLLGVLGLVLSPNENFPDWLLWILFLGVPSVIALIHMIVGIVDIARHGYGFRGALSLIYGGPILVFLLGALIYWLLYNVLLEALGVSERGLDSPAFWVALLIWSLLVFFGSVFLAWRKLRDAKIPEYPRSQVEKPHHVRLFDNMALYSEPGIATPTLAQSFFPSAKRKLLKLWWEGPGDLFIRSDRYQLVFSFAEDGTNPQTVPAPVAPMTLVEFIHLLEKRVLDSGGVAGKLKSSVEFPADIDYELPAGAVFADHGDDQYSAEDHDEKAREFKKLKTTQDASDYFLYHAPKPAQSIRFGKNGPLDNPFGLDEAALRQAEDQNGFTYVFDPVAVGDSDTVMGFAADFAALLCLGGASHMDATATPATKIHQVFRNWSLDRRRENEWRMLVAGGAISEKGEHPEKFDSLMLRPLDPDAYTSPLAAVSPAVVAEGERITREMGWVPLMRQWLNLIQHPTSDPLAETRLNPDNPTNRALNRGMAFLLDMSDPVAVP